MSSLVINSVLSGGNVFSASGAVLRVLAPTGSSVTVSRSGTTKTANGISLLSESGTSCYYFSFKSSEYSSSAWTVTATLGADSDSDTIVINAAGEYGVVLAYWDGELYDDGNEYTSITGGWVAFAPVFGSTAEGCSKNDTNLRVNFTSGSDDWKNGAWGTTNLIDLSHFTTLHITATTSTATGSNASNFRRFGVTSVKDNTASGITPYAAITAAGTFTLDISSVNSGYIWFGGSTRSSGSCDIVITKIWLT